MGTDLENVLEDLKQLKEHVAYWFQCRGDDDLNIETQLNDLEQALREFNERHAPKDRP